MTSFEIRPLIAIPPLNIVLIVDHASVSGGQAKVAIESAIGLKSAGANPILFAAAGPVDGRLADADVEVVCLGQTDLLGNRSRAAVKLRECEPRSFTFTAVQVYESGALGRTTDTLAN